MPYLITTWHNEDAAPVPVVPKPKDTRRVVATLGEARDRALSIVLNIEHAKQDPARVGTYSEADAVARSLPKEGGIIGPLPDGTVIEVTSVSWNWIIGVADDAGIDTDSIYADGGDLAILNAYNERIGA